MRFYFLIEVFVIVAVAWLVITQVLIPAVRGTRLLPFFRRERKLKDAKVDANQAQYEAELEQQLQPQPQPEKETPK